MNDCHILKKNSAPWEHVRKLGMFRRNSVDMQMVGLVPVDFQSKCGSGTLPWAPQTSRDVPADEDFLCDKPAVPGEKLNKGGRIVRVMNASHNEAEYSNI
jgi:hypothetical protein